MSDSWVVWEDAGQKYGHTTFPKIVQYNRNLSRHARFLYSLLLGYAWQDEQCFPGQQTLMDDMGCKHEQLKKYMFELRDAELISWKRRGQGKSNLYTIRKLNQKPPEKVILDPPKKGIQEIPKKGDYEETTTKETITNTPVGAPATPDATSDIKPEAKSDEFVSCLAEELTNADVPLLAGRKGRYGKEFKEQLGKGTTPSVLYKAADRIVERWQGDDHRKLTVEQAIEDVVNGKAPAHVGPKKSRLPEHEQWKEKAAGAHKLYFAPQEVKETEEEKAAREKLREERMAEFRRMKAEAEANRSA